MALSIKQHQEKWKLSISDEVWGFENRKEMEKVLGEILDMKEKYGKGVRD